MRVLLTGGMGFIGSHTAVVLQEAGHEPVLYDTSPMPTRVSPGALLQSRGRLRNSLRATSATKRALKRRFATKESKPSSTSPA